MQLRLGALATELRSLEAVNADRIFYARAHRIHTRLQAYDQLLAEACKLANVPIEGIDRESGSYPSEDERFRAEIELAARGWHW